MARHFKDAMGLFGWRSDDLVVHGGMRDRGLHKPDAVRSTFVAYDMHRVAAEGWDKAKLADLVMSIKPGEPPTINGLIDLKLPPALRRQGHGTRIVSLLVEASGDRLVVHDIKRSAVGFWRKAGIAFAAARGPSAAKGATIEGVIDRRVPEPEDAPGFAP